MTPKYKSPKAFLRKVEKYFESCGVVRINEKVGELLIPVKDINGNDVFKYANPPTMTGLALYMGFTSRQALLNYRNKPEFVDAIDYARAKVEEYAEQRLYDREGVGGAKFNLVNNFGWSDERTVELGKTAAGAVIGSGEGMTMADKLNYLRTIASKAVADAPDVQDDCDDDSDGGDDD